jgi:L-seryl-tRNA(Ser) seleniumtransferase
MPLRREGVPARWALAAAREAIDACRQRLLDGADGETGLDAVLGLARVRAERLSRPNLRPLINATGVVLHTNLGRAPLAEPAVAALVSVARGYSNLEYDLSTGRRGTRFSHVDQLLRALSGAAAAHAVNNNAAAVVLALAALAAGQEVIISRGELIEIGGSFRIPEMLELSGASLVEVGTTNRTRLADYEAAIGERTAAILRVHQSNFRTVGFSARVGIEDLAELARTRGVRLIDDLGSGAVSQIADEPLLRDSAAAADLVCCSADKLLGGPQAGLIVGRADDVEHCRQHPLARVVRLDKLQLAALEATVRIHLEGRADELPVEAMLQADPERLERRAATMAELIGAPAAVAPATSLPGGGSLPLLELDGPVCAVEPGPAGAEALASKLREGEPPVVARISKGRLLLDPRTMSAEDARAAAARVIAALGRGDD